MSDPITVDLVSQKGFTIKNNGNDVDAKAVLYRGGEEIDTGGTAYTYTWKLWNSAGTSVVKTYTGKSITVSKADVNGERRADVRGIEINDMSYNEYEGAKYFLGHPHCV